MPEHVAVDARLDVREGFVYLFSIVSRRIGEEGVEAIGNLARRVANARIGALLRGRLDGVQSEDLRLYSDETDDAHDQQREAGRVAEV